MLLAADEVLRSSPAEADAAVLSCLVSIQHMLASKGAAAAALSHSRSLAGRSSATSSSTAGAAGLLGMGGGGGGAGGLLSSAVGSVTKGVGSVTKGAANLTFKAAATAVSAAKTLSMVPGRDGAGSAFEGRGQQGLGRAKPKVPHVVACVSTTSSKSVAAAFFGPPGATSSSSSSGAAAAAAAAAGGAAAGAGGGLAGRGVVGSRLFTYELLVPGEIEGSVLVNVANEPLYVKVCAVEGVDAVRHCSTVAVQSQPQLAQACIMLLCPDAF